MKTKNLFCLIACVMVIAMTAPQVVQARVQYPVAAILVRDAAAYNILTQSRETVQQHTFVEVIGRNGSYCLVDWYEEYKNWLLHRDWLACSALYFNVPI